MTPLAMSNALRVAEKWLNEGSSMCDHGDDKKLSYFDILHSGEIYMCECGVLIDISQGDVNAPMTPDELQKAIRDEIADARKKLADKIRDALNDDDSC